MKEPFIMMPRSLLTSEAWQDAGIHVRRLVDFLMVEHMAHAGKENGKLKAPHRQLAEAGIYPCYISNAIREAEELGLIDCHRGGMRVATTYQINWLKLPDGSDPTPRWASYKRPSVTK